MTNKQYVDEVIREINFIKSEFTEQEKEKINIHLFDPDDSEKCIYGLSTGDCQSIRAISLTTKLNPIFSFESQCNSDIAYSKYLLDREEVRYYTALENYISIHYEHNEQIIQYIKGEINELPDLSI